MSHSLSVLKAVDLVMSQRLVEVELVSSSGKKEHVYVP